MTGFKLVLFTCLLFINTTLLCQIRPETFIVRAGDSPLTSLPFGYRYLNNEFREGYLAFQLGNKSNVYKFNLDLLIGKLSFINEKKDTMFVEEDVAVKYVHMGKDAYYHDLKQGYFRVLATDTLGKLASHVEMVHYVPTNIGYGTTKIKTTAITTTDNGKEQTFERTLTYVLIDSRGTLSPCTKTSIFAMFPNQDEKIKAFMKQNKTSFKKEADLVKLFEYCVSLNPL